MSYPSHTSHSDREAEDRIREALSGIATGTPVVDAIGQALMKGFAADPEGS